MFAKITTLIVSVSCFIIMASTQASALGFKATVKTKGDTFKNSGKIIANQKVKGGVGNQKVGQRVRSQEDIIVEYDSKGNKYINSGTIKGDQSVLGGLGNQAVGQEVY